MKRKFYTIILILVIATASFIVGGFAYRAGMFSRVKKSIIPPPTPTTIPEIIPSFSFEVLDDPSVASLNNKKLVESNTPLKFLAVGHIYGRTGESSFHPAMTLLTNLAVFREADFDMIFFLGDMVWTSKNEDFDNLEEFLIDRLQTPIFNAVGNHDVARRQIYENRYGNTVYAFEYKKNLFIIVDTNLKYYDLTSSQTSFIEEVITHQLQTKNIENIHLMMHNVLFLDSEEIIGKQILKPNSGDGFSETFQDLLRNVLYPASESAPVYIYAGDVGAFGNLSPFYKKSKDHEVYFFAIGIGNKETDSVLIVKQGSDGSLNFTPFSLLGEDMLPIEEYDFEYWLKR